jgi:uncharacterized LabA/DUF88 family protein
MKKVGVFVDVSNLYYNINKKYFGRKLDYKKYLIAAVGPENILYQCFAYWDRDDMPFLTCLKHFGYQIRIGVPFEMNLKLALDIERILTKIDRVVLGTSNVDVMPLVYWVKEKGVECNVLSSLIPRDLKYLANNALEISEELLENKDIVK